jgi:Transposase (partial DDE domain)
MVLAFFDNKGMVYTNYAPRGKTICTDYVIKVLSIFLDVMKEKKPELRAGEWFFQRDNAHLHSAKAVKGFLAQRSI